MNTTRRDRPPVRALTSSGTETPRSKHGVILAAALGESFPGEAAIVRDGSLPYHLTIRELPTNIRPRERLRAMGPEALADDELIAIILRTGTQSNNVLDVARALLARLGNLDGIARASQTELASTRGIGPVKAVDLQAAFELGRRLTAWAPDQQPEITSPEHVYGLLSSRMARLEREEVRVILLNTKNRVQRVAEVSAGSLNSSIIRVAEVFREAVRQQAAAIVLAHNHPSGDPTPSAEDVAITKKIVDAGKLLDIEVLDHIIIGKPGVTVSAGWVSLRDRGLGFGRG